MEEKQLAGLEAWSIATWKRRLLAWYLDFLLFGAPWGVIVWGLSQGFPGLQRLSFPLKLGFFIVLQMLVLRLISGSPGHLLLGIRRFRVDPFVTPEATERSPRYLVEPWLKSNERWWTIMFGVLAILNGAKTLVRWTLFTPAIPFMGYQLGEWSSPTVLMVLGILECTVGCLALRLGPSILATGIGLYGAGLISVFLNWQLWPDWIERYVIARRTYQGLAVRQAEVEMMQQIVPTFMIMMGTVMFGWVLLVGARSRRARTA